MTFTGLILVISMLTIALSMVAIAMRVAPQTEQKHSRQSAPIQVSRRKSRGRHGSTWMAAAVFVAMAAGFVFSEIFYMSALGWICVIMSVPALIGYAVSD